MLERRDLSDPRTLKVLGHPIRQRILDRLARTGAATSAMIARELDLNTGVTSYHLRELAAHGLIQPDVERSTGRKKYWRRVRQDLRIPNPSQLDPAARPTARAVTTSLLRRDLETVAHQVADRIDDPIPSQWADAELFSTSVLRLSAAELAELTAEYLHLLRRWHREPDDAPPSAQPVQLLFFAFPLPAPKGAIDDD